MAIDELLNEHEQSEKVRDWLRHNALGLVGGVGLGLAVIAGLQWWKGQQLQAGMDASSRYTQTVEAFEKGLVPKNGKELVADVDKGNRTLGTLATLQLAKAQLDKGNREDAIATLRGLKEADPDLRAVVNQRLARLLIDAGKASEALSLLNDERNAAMLETRGDAQFALGEREKAREAYRKALALIDVGAPQHKMVSMKLLESGGTPPHTGEAR